MKRVIGGVSVLVLLLAGCSDQDKSESDTPSPRASESTAASSADGVPTTSEAPESSDTVTVSTHSEDPSTMQSVSSSTEMTGGFTAAGSLVLRGKQNFTRTEPGYGMDLTCKGTGVFADIHKGTQVIVYTADGTAVGSGELGTGTNNVDCLFSWYLEDVPYGNAPYLAEVGAHGKTAFGEPEGGLEGVMVKTELGG